MATNLLTKEGTIFNDMQCLDILGKLAKNIPDAKFINGYAEKIENAVSYLDASGNETNKDSGKANYKWVSSGYQTPSGEIIYFSFYKGRDGDWKGAWVGTGDFLLEKAFGDYVTNQKPTSINQKDTTGQKTSTYNVYNELYDRLLMKERWKNEKENKLPKYLANLCLKVENQIKKNKRENQNDVNFYGFTINESRTKIILNTGLLDRFRNDIFMMFNLNKNSTEETVSGPALIINSKLDAIVNDFTAFKYPEPFRFYNTIDELLLSASIEDFDLSDINRLNHIINERRDRFPEGYKDMNEDQIAQKLKTAIETALKISKRDYKYIVPMYNLQQDRIQYLMPLYLDNPIDDVPELVLVVGKNPKYNICSIMTIISREDAYMNARLIARPDATWLGEVC